MESKKPEEHAKPAPAKKASYSRAWFILLAMICFVVAFWKPIRGGWWRMRNRSLERAEAAVQRDSDSFVAISFEGVSREKEPSGRFIQVDRLRDHLSTLAAAGYHPIGLKDVRDFYLEGRPLPSKAVLLTFENAHKSTYFDASSVLRSMRWRATMGVVTGPVRAWDEDVLLRPYLKDMALDALWDLACESDSGTSFVPSDARGGVQPFFSSRQWIADENRHETLAEFQARIGQDHARALEEFTNHIGVVPVAFFFPGGNYGQFGDGNWALREANLEAVERNYSIGFGLNNRSLNTRRTDPRRLNRLSVPPDWSSNRLLRELDLSWPVATRRSGDSDIIGPERWHADWGILYGDEDSVTLLARPADDPRRTEDDATGGARAWITGSNLFSEGTLDLRFELVRGEFHIYLRFAADDDFLRFAVSDTGHASLVRTSPGSGEARLADEAIDFVSDFRTSHRLLLTLRDDVLFARLDGNALFNGPVILGSGKDSSGLVGVGVWDSTPGLATVDLLETHMRTRLDGIATWSANLSRDIGHITRNLANDAFRYSFVSPPWLDVAEESPIVFQLPEGGAFDIAVRSNRCAFYPAILLHGDAAFNAIPPARIVPQLAALHADGVFLDADDLSPARIGDLRTCIAMLAPLLEKEGRGIIVRAPHSVQELMSAGQLLADLPGVRLASETGLPPPGIDPSRMATVLRIAPPATGLDGASSVVQVYAENPPPSDDGDAPDDSPEGMERLRNRGMEAFHDGDYSGAARLWTRWTEVDPGNPEAWAFLGNAHNRLRNAKPAADAYQRSLALEPGQIDLALECVRLLESSNRDVESGNLLDMYARAFPDDSRIAISQALWLDRHRRRPEGREIMARLVDESPTDIPRRLTLQSLLDSPADRYGNMHELLDLVKDGGDAQLLGFGHDLESAELLTIPESTVFFDFIRHTATNSVRKSVHELYSGFLPFADPITEEFDSSRLSDRWITIGTPLSSIVGAYDLKAASNMSEAYLRLRNSELMRDGFIEVTLGESVGAFWLYARRSSRNMVRFGFDGDGFLRIQTWSNGESRTTDSRPWVRPAGDIVLRLEVRGDGAVGIVNGKPAFATPLPIPQDIAYGWWSVAPFSPELGIARARITRIGAGPMKPGIAIVRETDNALAADALDLLRPRARELSAVAPVLFVQYPDGSIQSTPIADIMPFRMFCSYHRLRLMPVVSLDYFSDVRAETLVDIIVNNRLSGLVLQMRSMPDEKWIAHATELIEKTAADLVIIQSDKPLWPVNAATATAESEIRRISGLPPVTVRELQRGSLLLSPVQPSWEVPLIPYQSWEPAGRGAKGDGVSPNLVILPPLSLPHEPPESEAQTADAPVAETAETAAAAEPAEPVATPEESAEPGQPAAETAAGAKPFAVRQID